MNPLKASQSTVCGLAWKRYSRQTPLRDVAPALNGRAALPGCGHAERALQASWWQEHGAAHAGGPSAQQAGKLETRALFAGSQGGTVARAGGNACGPLSVRLDLKAPAVPWSDTDHTGQSISLASMPMARSRGFRAQAVQGPD